MRFAFGIKNSIVVLHLDVSNESGNARLDPFLSLPLQHCRRGYYARYSSKSCRLTAQNALGNPGASVTAITMPDARHDPSALQLSHPIDYIVRSVRLAE